MCRRAIAGLQPLRAEGGRRNGASNGQLGGAQRKPCGAQLSTTGVMESPAWSGEGGAVRPNGRARRPTYKPRIARVEPASASEQACSQASGASAQGERSEPVVACVRVFRARVREGKCFIYRGFRWVFGILYFVIASRIY